MSKGTLACSQLGGVITDIPATNGFLHANDKVLLPVPIDDHCER